MFTLIASVEILALLLQSSASGTLVVLVPSASGLVIAADSRLSAAGTYCDNGYKIIEPRKPKSTVLAITGNSSFVEANNVPFNDLCQFLRTAPRLLDIGSLVKAYLERKGSPISKLQLADLSEQCAAALRQFQTEHPSSLWPFDGREVFFVIIASYNASTKTATVVNFVVRIEAGTHKIQADRLTQSTISPKSKRDVLAFGETDYLNKHVYGGVGRQYLTAETISFILTDKPIIETPSDQAIAVAANVIEAVGRTTALIPAPRGIGGPTDIVILGRKKRPQRVRWKDR